jgi:hypothetical protein
MKFYELDDTRIEEVKNAIRERRQTILEEQ